MHATNKTGQNGQPTVPTHRLQMGISMVRLSSVREHQLPNKVRYLGPLMQQLSQILSGRLESEHLLLLKILT
jgi:hypothetical protein